jgi:hypothetical protein
MTSPMARLQQKKQAAVTTGLARSTGIPCAMVYGLYRDLLGDRAFLPPSSLRSLLLKNLTSASGGRDHATSPSAKGHVRLTCHPRPSHPRPTCRDDRAYVPLHRGRMREKIVLICPTPQARTHAADWHDGQFSHGAHAGIACRRRRNAPSYRFIMEDHDPPYELDRSRPEVADLPSKSPWGGLESKA